MVNRLLISHINAYSPVWYYIILTFMLFHRSNGIFLNQNIIYFIYNFDNSWPIIFAKHNATLTIIQLTFNDRHSRLS